LTFEVGVATGAEPADGLLVPEAGLGAVTSFGAVFTGASAVTGGAFTGAAGGEALLTLGAGGVALPAFAAADVVLAPTSVAGPAEIAGTLGMPGGAAEAEGAAMPTNTIAVIRASTAGARLAGHGI
jgi:hypothetical protein